MVSRSSAKTRLRRTRSRGSQSRVPLTGSGEMRAIAGGLLLKTGEYDASAERAAPQDTTPTRRGRRVQTWPILPVFEVSVVFLIAISAAFWGAQGACQCWLCRFRVPLSRAADATSRRGTPAAPHIWANRSH